MEPLFKMPLKEILSELNLSQNINEALLEHKNILGRLLLLVENSEENNFSAVASILNEMNISMDKYNAASLDGICWAQENGNQCLQQSYA